MAKFNLKIRALEMRKEGVSIRTITKVLGVSKGTVSLWCRDVVLTPLQLELLRVSGLEGGNKGLMIAAEKRRHRRLRMMGDAQRWATENLPALSQRDHFVAGCALYWAEGSKKGSKLTLTNSDPAMITFMFRWFQELGVPKDQFMPRIFINDIHRPRIEKVLNFWSYLLELPTSQFGNPVFLKIKQKKVYTNYDDYYGVLALGVSKGRELKYRILSLIERMKMPV